MKKLVTLFLSLAFLVCGALPALADSGGYTISNYQVDAVLREDNTVQQTETIEVNFTEPRHGIYRELPLTMYVGRNVDGESISMEYRNKVEDVSVVGAPYEIGTDDGYYSIRIGDADETVTGTQQYTISFVYSMPDDRLDDGDFLFYSVLGSEWNTTIDHFSFHMTFDKPFSEEILSNVKLYSGAFGGTENAMNVAYTLTTDGISGTADDIGANQAITIFTDLPQGYFVGARTTPAWPAWAMAVLVLLLSGYTVIRALRTHNSKPVQTVEFYPPDGISSAEAGYIIDREANEEDLLSLIPWWAEKGYLTIEEKPDKKGRTGKHSTLILHQKKNLPDRAPSYMKTLFHALFAHGETSDLEKLNTKFAEKLSTACEVLGNEFVGTRELYTSTALPVVLIILPCVALTGMLILCSAVAWDSSNIVFGIIAGAALILLGLLLFKRRFSENFTQGAGNVFYIIAAVICLAAAAGCTALCMGGDCLLPAPVLWIAYAVTAASSLLASRLIQPTPYNVQISGKLMGLKHFIQTAEMPRLKLLLEKDPSYYYDILPYAMVFGLTDQWANQFKDLSVLQPDWYYGSNTMFNIWYFNTMMHQGIQKPIEHVKAEAAREAAKASAVSGGGGGFAGGGGGGGGGGSW